MVEATGVRMDVGKEAVMLMVELAMVDGVCLLDTSIDELWNKESLDRKSMKYLSL